MPRSSIRSRLRGSGWAEQQPDDWWKAAQAALRQLGARGVAGIGLSGQMHGLVVLDEKLQRSSSCDSLERSADVCRVRRDRGARRARASHQAHGQQSADGVHRAEAPVAPQQRSRRLPADRPPALAEGLCPVAPDRGARDRRRRRIRDIALRRRSPVLGHGVARGARAPARTSPPGARVAAGLGGDSGGDCGCGRGRGSGGRCARRRCRPAGPFVGAARHLGRRVRCAALVSGRSRGARPRVLPRRPRRVACDGRDALRCRFAPLAP